MRSAMPACAAHPTGANDCARLIRRERRALALLSSYRSLPAVEGRRQNAPHHPRSCRFRCDETRAGDPSAHSQASPISLPIQGSVVKGKITGARRLTGLKGLCPEVRSTPKALRDLQHKLSVVRRRALFFDKTLARATVEATVRLDTLTKQYAMIREIDGHRVESASADSFERAQVWLTDVHGIMIELPKDAGSGTLEVRVKTEYEKTLRSCGCFPFPSALDEKECQR